MRQTRAGRVVLCLAVMSMCVSGWGQQAATGQKPRVTLDEFFNFVQYTQADISPDGKAVVIGTERADWKQERFRKDLWLWRDGVGITLLTASGHDSDAQWSPDGKWIAFISDREMPGGAEAEEEEQVPQQQVKPEDKPKPTPPKGRDEDEDKKEKNVAHVYVISTIGGEALPVTRGMEEVHSFAWSPDSKSIYFATRTPWNKAKRDQ